MSQHHRPPRADVVSVLFAIHIKQIRAISAGNKQRAAADTIEGADR